MATPLTTPPVAVPQDGTPSAGAATAAPEGLPSAGPVLVSLTQDQLDKMLRAAVLAGQAQAAGPYGGPAVVVDKPVIWTENEFYRNIVSRLPWHDEYPLRCALATVDNLYPLPDVDEEEA